MGRIRTFIQNQIDKRIDEYERMSSEIDKWTSFMSSVLETKGDINLKKYTDQLDDLYTCLEQSQKLADRQLFITLPVIRNFIAQQSAFSMKVNSFESSIAEHNRIAQEEKIAEVRSLIGKIEDHELDDQQILCILTDSHNHNVIAGAGTGKTTTIIGKVKYMLMTEKYKPEDFIVLTYTKAAAMEMKARLMKNTNADITVSTFHRFGYSILGKVEGKKPDLYKGNITSFVKQNLSNKLKDQDYQNGFIWFLQNGSGRDVTDLDDRFTDEEKYKEYVRTHEPTTLKGEAVKSYGEMHVANFLALKGIRYEYERKYEYDTASSEYSQYYPDFYLPDYQIYIEYFGIDRNGNVPDWFDGDNPSQTYQEGMQWKRNLHQEHHTKLVECYSYEDKEKTLENNLLEKLTPLGVATKQLTFEEVIESTGRSYEEVTGPFITIACTVISLARNKRISSEHLKTMAVMTDDVAAMNIARLVAPIFKDYEQELRQRKEIDFSDMLNRAEDYVKEGRYSHSYKCVIVDEYQDISSSQYRLLKELRNKHDFSLFCVGDDWQSIYRFNGSDVSYIMNFEKYWGPSEISRIETTYRFSQSLIDISGKFIMKNPSQIKKQIRSGMKDTSFALSKIEGYKSADAVKFMTEKLLHLPERSTVYLIGRYTFDIRLLEQDKRLSVRFDTGLQTQVITLDKRKDLRITYYTAHRSKGLQADYVFIINNSSGYFGFPSKVEDNPLTSLLLEQEDRYLNAEERRLFYVAMTRARKHVYLLTVKDKESSFETELENTYGSRIINETYVCPVCGANLKVRESQYGKFLGCTNYRITGCKYTVALGNGNGMGNEIYDKTRSNNKI